VSVVTVYAVFATPEEAMTIGRMMVEERLAACINVLAPCTSIYRWEGKVERSGETPALLKTTGETAEALIVRLTELHSYEVPAIVVWPIERLPAAYGDWVERNVR